MPIPVWSRSLTNRLIKKSRMVVVDSGLAARLSGVTDDDLLTPLGSNHLGPLLEGFIVAELLKQQTWSDRDFHIWHYREAGGLEVDIVVALSADRLIGMEVKATTTLKPQHARGLRLFKERMGDQMVSGILWYLGNQVVSLGEGIWAAPVPALWEWAA